MSDMREWVSDMWFGWRSLVWVGIRMDEVADSGMYGWKGWGGGREGER